MFGCKGSSVTINDNTWHYQEHTCDEPPAFCSVVIISLIAFDQYSGIILRANAPSFNRKRKEIRAKLGIESQCTRVSN